MCFLLRQLYLQAGNRKILPFLIAEDIQMPILFLSGTSTSHTRVFKNEKDYVESFQPTELEVFCCSFYFDEWVNENDNF